MTVKGKVFPFYAMMAYRGVEVYPHLFLTLAVDGDAKLTSRPDALLILQSL
jgi:hypothetical protein